MHRFLVRRVIESLVALWIATILIFVGIRMLPGDPIVAMSGESDIDPTTYAQLQAKYGLDQPLPVQYLRWVSVTLTGDLGSSIRSNASVTEIIVQRLPITLELAALAMLFAICVGIPLGLIAAVRRGRWIDYVVSVIGVVGLSIPTFWLGLVFVLVFAVALGVMPASGFVPLSDDPVANISRMVMPSIVLGGGLAAVIMRQTRSAVISALSSEYVRTARAKGLNEWRVVLRHALRNSLITVVTIVGLELGALISGAVITETIFLIPGFGRLIMDAVSWRDYPIIQGVALVSVTVYVVINFVVDVLYTVLNPRIRLGGPVT